MDNLIGIFYDIPIILDLIQSIQREVNKQKKYLSVILKLKDPTFKKRHWEQLFREMFPMQKK